MIRTSIQTPNQDQGALASPIARDFVRIVMARRGVTAAEAGKIYLDYINRSAPTGNRRQRKAA